MIRIRLASIAAEKAATCWHGRWQVRDADIAKAKDGFKLATRTTCTMTVGLALGLAGAHLIQTSFSISAVQGLLQRGVDACVLSDAQLPVIQRMRKHVNWCVFLFDGQPNSWGSRRQGGCVEFSANTMVMMEAGLTATGGLYLGAGGTAIGMAAGVATGIAYDGIVTMITGKKDGGCFVQQDATKAPLSACSSICVPASTNSRIVL